MTRKEIEQAARDAGPWTSADEREAERLRKLVVPLTKAQGDALRVLRQREINESIRRLRRVK